MPKVFLGLGTNIDRDRSMRAGLAALRALDQALVVSPMYKSEAVGFDGAPFYNCVVQLRTELALTELVAELKIIEDANGRNRAAKPGDEKGLDIDVLTYGDLVGEFDGAILPRSDILRYAHVLRPLADIAPDSFLPGTSIRFQTLWHDFGEKGQQLSVVTGWLE